MLGQIDLFGVAYTLHQIAGQRSEWFTMPENAVLTWPRSRSTNANT